MQGACTQCVQAECTGRGKRQEAAVLHSAGPGASGNRNLATQTGEAEGTGVEQEGELANVQSPRQKLKGRQFIWASRWIWH